MLAAGLKLGLAYADNPYTISGTLSFNGNPVSGDQSNNNVIVGFGDGNGHGGSPRVDTSGAYSIGNLPNGNYSSSTIGIGDNTIDSAVTGEPNTFSLSTPNYPVVVNGGDVTQNTSFVTNEVTVTVKDGSGNPVSGSQVKVTQVGSGTVTSQEGIAFTAGQTQETQSLTTSGVDGIATVRVFPGLTYSVCAFTASNNQYCTSSNVAVSGDTTAEVDFPMFYTVSGAVSFNGTPVNGQPLTSNQVVVGYATNDGSGAGGSVYVDSSGNYSTAGLPNETYNVGLVTANNTVDSATTGEPNSFNLSTSSPYLTVSGSNQTQNISFNTNSVTVTVKDGSGNPVSGSKVRVTQVGVGNVTSTEGIPFTALSDTAQSISTSQSNGIATVRVFPGLTYSICALTPDGNNIYCTQSHLTVNSDSTATVYLESVPSAPTDLSIPSPTHAPVITWSSVSGADSYNVYANGTFVGSTTATTYTDNSAVAGTDLYYITAVNLAGESPHSNSVSVVVGNQPTITSTNSASTAMRTNFDFQVTTTGSPAPAITESGALPAGITLTDNGDGTADLAGDASAGTNGSYPITITASNGIGTSATQSFTLTITTATSAPTITSSNNDTETVSAPFSFTVTTNGYPVPTLSKTGALPSGVTFTNNGDGTATIAGTTSVLGTYTPTLKATSSAGTVTQSFSLTITKVPVIATIQNKNIHVGTPFTMTITSSGYPTPALSESGTLPDGLTFTYNGDRTATISGTPTVGSGGSYSITITATNTYGSSSKTFKINVDEAPVITSDSSTTTSVGSAFSFQIITTGYPIPTLSKVGTLPSGVTFRSGARTISGTPAAGTAGTYTITITAKNSSGTVSQNFVLTVN